MFDRFTEEARLAMTRARTASLRMAHDYIGTEHFLLALAQGTSSISSRALAAQGIDHARVLAAVEAKVERGKSTVFGTRLPFTPRMKRILEYALEASVDLGHSWIGTGHLLCGLLRESDGPGADVLRDLGVDTMRLEYEARALEAGEKPLPASEEEEPPATVDPDPADPLPPPETRRTPRLRRVLALAEIEARSVGNGAVSTAHLLLALLKEGSGAGVGVLERLGLGAAEVREELVPLLTTGETWTDGPRPLDAPAEAALENARLEAEALGHTYIGTEHLLLGLVHATGGPAADILRALGMEPETIRRGIRDLLKVELPECTAPGGPSEERVLNAIADEALKLVGVFLPGETVEIEARYDGGVRGTPYGIMIMWRKGRRARSTLVHWAPDADALRRSVPRLVGCLVMEVEEDRAGSGAA